MEWDADLHRQESTTKYEKIKSLVRYISESESYVRLIVDYSERYRYGEAISTGFVESTVNYVIAKRFIKKPRHGGSKCNKAKRGAHQMLVVRTNVLDEDWESEFKKLYPLFRSQSCTGMSMAA